ncbi:hypothetical protein ND436_002850 [Neisseria gonorrhoeae]|nr:hypothetical protein [Neisseria gonorrhoeae]UYP52480.1 hypothetical protein ND436_002850 [Neisseria gonorrhoeae]
MDSNRLSARSKAQKENIARMLSGAKVSEDEALTCGIMMRLSLQDMRYACNQELINFAEHIVKQVQRLYRTATRTTRERESVLFACREASQAVAQWTKDFDDPARISANSCCVRCQILRRVRRISERRACTADSRSIGILITRAGCQESHGVFRT